MSENEEAKNGISPNEAEKGPKKEEHEETCEIQPQEKGEQEEQEEEDSAEPITPQKMIVLQRDLTTLVTNIQTAADAKESMRRTELEEAHRLRLERLEKDAKLSQEKFEEITRGWSVAKEKVTPQELQEALNSQQQLCATLTEDKKKLINELQQELKAGGDHFIKDLRHQSVELEVMMERMENQIRTLTKAYREELTQKESIYHQEIEVLLSRDKTEWEQQLKEIWDNEGERLMHRHKEDEKNEVIIHNRMLETTNKLLLYHAEQKAQSQVLQRKKHQVEATTTVTKIKKIKQKDVIKQSKICLAEGKSRIISLRTELRNLRDKTCKIKTEITKKSHCLYEEYKRYNEQYERTQRKINHFAVADARKFEQMWLTVEAEVKQLVEGVLSIDSQICECLGLAWQRPRMAFMELSGPIRPHKQPGSPARQAASQQSDDGQASQSLSAGPKVEPDTEGTDLEMSNQGTAVQSEGGAEVEEGKTEILQKVMELLCDEVGSQMEGRRLELLAPLEREEQMVLKLGSLLSTFDIELEDVPSLAEFLLKNAHQQREQAEDVCVDSGEVETHLTSDLIHPNRILPVLKSFLEQQTQSRESSAHQHHSLHVEARDASEDKAYWESMGNIISEDKVKLWDTAEKMLCQRLALLIEISELIPETQRLKQQNTELRMLLQVILQSGVSPELETP